MDLGLAGLVKGRNHIGLASSETSNLAPQTKYPALSPIKPDPEIQNTRVTLSPQAQIIQHTGEQNNNQNNNDTADEASSKTGNESIRVTGSIGEAASAVGLSEQEAIKLYQSIKDLL